MTDESSRQLSRILIVSVVVCGVALVSAGAWYYGRERDGVERAAAAELAAVAHVKAEQIANWRQERIGDGGVLSSPPAADLARRVLSGEASDTDRANLRALLQRFIVGFEYAGGALVDANGEVRMEMSRNHSEPARYRSFQRAVPHGGSVLLSDLYLDALGEPWMMLTVLVPGGGAILLDIEPSVFLYPYVLASPAGSNTGETILARREGKRLVYLSQGLQSQGPPPWGGGSWSRALPENALAGYRKEWTDDRGVRVMGVLEDIPDSNWALIAKTDVAVVHEPLRRLAWTMVLVIVLIAAANTAAAALIWRSRQVRIYRDREAWYRQITNETPAYLWMTSPGMAGCFLNWRFARFLGTERDELDTFWENYIHPEDREKAATEYSVSLEGRCEYRDEFRMRRFDGAYRWMVAQGLPRFTPRGEFAGYTGALADITERREAEQELHALSARLINAREEERRRLARDLHDDLSQQLAAVSIAMSNLKKRLPPDSVEGLEQGNRIQKKLVNLAGSMRRLSHELHPAVLEHSGLAAALREYCSEYSALTSHRIPIRVEGVVDAVPPEVSLCVYRVAQEALQNSIKHSGVDEAEVVLTQSGDTLTLVVSDRGAGMSEDAARGLGLVSIRERTRLVNGTVEVRATPGEGVTLTLQVPIRPGRAQAAGRTGS
jgi:PAS domain S-box-containing protein